MAENTSTVQSTARLSLISHTAQWRTGNNLEKWKKPFEVYLKATRQATPGEVKTSLLVHALGLEGQEVYDMFVFEDKEI